MVVRIHVLVLLVVQSLLQQLLRVLLLRDAYLACGPSRFVQIKLSFAFLIIQVGVPVTTRAATVMSGLAKEVGDLAVLEGGEVGGRGGHIELVQVGDQWGLDPVRRLVALGEKAWVLVAVHVRRSLVYGLLNVWLGVDGNVFLEELVLHAVLGLLLPQSLARLIRHHALPQVVLVVSTRGVLHVVHGELSGDGLGDQVPQLVRVLHNLPCLAAVLVRVYHNWNNVRVDIRRLLLGLTQVLELVLIPTQPGLVSALQLLLQIMNLR